MRTRIFIAAVFFPLFAGIFCSQPVDPFKDYNNCEIRFITPTQQNTIVFRNDTVPISIGITGASLFNNLSLRYGSKDTTITMFSDLWSDTITVNAVFSTLDTIDVLATAVLSNKAVLSKTIRIIVIDGGWAPVISTEPPDSVTVEIGATCSVTVAAAGTPPLSYQWTQNGTLRAGANLATLRINDFQTIDTGVYQCIVTNPWGADTSRTVRLIAKSVDTTKRVFWHFAFYHDTLNEGDSINVRIDSFYSAPAGEAATLAFLDNTMSLRAALKGDSLFVFRAGARDSGLYAIPVVVSSASGSDTAQFLIKVNPRFCSLTLESDSGSIIVTPLSADLKYRWHDTVSLKAVPDSGYTFFSWSGDVSGSVDSLNVVVYNNMEIRARFVPKGDSGCIQLTGGSINATIRSVSPGIVRPKSICPAQGTYEEGTIKVLGTVRIDILR